MLSLLCDRCYEIIQRHDMLTEDLCISFINILLVALMMLNNSFGDTLYDDSKKMPDRASQHINLSSIIVKKIPNNSGLSEKAIVNLNQYDIR